MFLSRGLPSKDSVGSRWDCHTSGLSLAYLISVHPLPNYSNPTVFPDLNSCPYKIRRSWLDYFFILLLFYDFVSFFVILIFLFRLSRTCSRRNCWPHPSFCWFVVTTRSDVFRKCSLFMGKFYECSVENKDITPPIKSLSCCFPFSFEPTAK